MKIRCRAGGFLQVWDYKEGRLLSTVDRWIDGTKNQTHAYCVSNTDSVYIRTGLSSSSIHVYMLMMSYASRGRGKATFRNFHRFTADGHNSH